MSELKTLFAQALREIYDGEHLLVQGLSELELCADTALGNKRWREFRKRRAL